MGPTTMNGRIPKAGFTLIELLLVLTLIAMLAGLAVPIVSKSIQRAKGATLKEDLYLLRKNINDFYADHGHYPQTLEELVSERYIRALPVDPLTESYDTWQLEMATGEDEEGIRDVRSGYEGEAPDGTRYEEW